MEAGWSARIARWSTWVPKAIVLVAAAASAACDDETPGRVALGVWGGVGLVVTVSETAADAEFDCAIGHVAEPLLLDAGGAFEILGTMTLGHGGPIREDEPPDVHPAVYRGRLDGDVLHVSVRITDLGTTTDTFALRHHNPGLLRRCL